MKTDRHITIKTEGIRHRFIIDQGTYSLQSNKTYPTRAEAMHQARKAASRLRFDFAPTPKSAIGAIKHRPKQ